ncbi:amino acid adenylation domain-containing protein [Streptomyces bambusae]|uniref:non-ribosomal peptide synthetase n=1 Tax=Streptomyces bambusae TaxID=1550616 RepID=UPI001CFCF4B4|nr:non-ribosomal peptide synthetase [Streptomyces bambusae]MCB5163534.1 amino acid adenylation domain-containing protein [Streptomyces bambusae]
MTAVLPERATAPTGARVTAVRVTAADAAPADLLARLAQVPGDRPAVVAADRCLSFDGLRGEAAAIAARLAAHGVGPESVVALCLPRGADLVAALLGTLTAGAAYLPVDPKLPAERRRYLVEDSGADLVVTAGAGAEPLAAGVPHLPVAALTAPGTEPAEFRPVPVPGDSLAYVIYTSGSTGRPKGVEIGRDAAARLLAELEGAGIAVTDGGRVGWNASPSFDASVQQWVRICRGDTIVMIDEDTRQDPALLAAFVDEQALTDLDITPSHADPLLDLLTADGGPRPLTLLVGGEAVSPSLWARIAERSAAGVLRAVNVYGPTECTVDSTAGWIEGPGQPHIGAVLPGLRMRLLDEKLQEVGPGGTGELYLAGPRVARGYRRRAGLTAERFVPDLAGGRGGRMYRTGDLCRLLADGRLEYLGRADGQVKLRGHRIELPEIEAALAWIDGIAEAAVTVREDLGGAPGLAAYYRPAAGKQVDAGRLRELLAAELPGYMVPAAFTAVDRFPTTPNGKLDRAALPAPAPLPAAAPAGQTGAGALTGAVEQLIGGVWATVLGAERIGPEDNFFKLGGHSLLAIKLVSRVRNELSVALPVKAVYAHPRLRDLAAHIEELLAARDA